MFLLTTNKRLAKQQEKGSQQSQMVESIQRKCREAQKELASCLQNKVEKLNVGAKKVCLIAFCLFSSICCVCIAVQSWQSPEWNHSSFVKIRFPLYTPLSPDKMNINQAHSGDSLLRRIKKFQIYMDSLSLTAAGKIIRDSILKARPGLMDSIAQIQNTLIK